MELASPRRVAGGRAGSFWVADPGLGLLYALGDGGPEIALASPRALALTAAEDAAFVAAGGEVARVALADPGASAAPAAAIAGARDLALDEEAGALFVAAAAGLLRVELSSGRAEPLASVSGEIEGLALAPDRRRLYFTEPAAGDVRAVELGAPRGATIGGAPLATVVITRGLSRPAAVCVTPAGLAVADAGAPALVGVNPRHGTTTAIWRGAPLVEPVGVAFDRPGRSYLVADAGARCLFRIAVDGSGCAPLS